MRLAIFARIDKHIDLIPLDISIPNTDSSKFGLDDVVKYIRTLAKILIPGSIDSESAYILSKDGIILNSELTLSQNGIKNGDIVDVIQQAQQEKEIKLASFEIKNEEQTPQVLNPKPLEEDFSSKQLDHDSNQNRPIPGKKIDFE